MLVASLVLGCVGGGMLFKSVKYRNKDIADRTDNVQKSNKIIIANIEYEIRKEQFSPAAIIIKTFLREYEVWWKFWTYNVKRIFAIHGVENDNEFDFSECKKMDIKFKHSGDSQYASNPIDEFYFIGQQKENRFVVKCGGEHLERLIDHYHPMSLKHCLWDASALLMIFGSAMLFFGHDLFH